MPASASLDEGEMLDFDPRNLPMTYQRAIGLVAASSAQTESMVQMAICACLGVDAEYGWAVTTHMNAPMRDNVLRSVAELRIDDLDALDELDEILDAISDANNRRNDHVHGDWCRKESTGQVFIAKIKARGSVQADLIPVSVDQIKADAQLIYDLGIRLFKFLMRHGLEAALPPPSRPRGHKSKAARKARRKGAVDK